MTPERVLLAKPEGVNFGDLPEAIDALLQSGVKAYRHDRNRADELFRQALAVDPEQLPTYFCLYKIHTYQGNLDEAHATAESGLKEAARQAGWSTNWREWQPEIPIPDGAGRFALYTLKALAFIHLRRDEASESQRYLDKLADLGAMERVGGTVIAAIKAGVA